MRGNRRVGTAVLALLALVLPAAYVVVVPAERVEAAPTVPDPFYGT